MNLDTILDSETEGQIKELIQIYYHDTGEILSMRVAIKSIINAVHGIMIER